MARLAGGLVFGVMVVLSLGWAVMSQPWSGSAQAPVEPRPAAHEGFAADRDGGFDAQRAMSYLNDVCAIGPRISGTEGMKKQQELLTKHLEAQGAKVRLQKFTAKQKSQAQPTEMANLIASWYPDRRRRVILCSHYDTRPIADQEPDRRKWHDEFLSANDGGSGVALLMELGRHLKELPIDVGVDLVFFDGEEYIFDPRPEPEGDRYFFGSEAFAKDCFANRARTTYTGAVLLDMIGGKDARFPIESNSWFKAGRLVEDLWKIAAEQKVTAFRTEAGPEVRDDHIALNKVGIPAVDIIDFSYPHWHRLSDVPDNCSAESLSRVARVLVVWLQRVK